MLWTVVVFGLAVVAGSLWLINAATAPPSVACGVVGLGLGSIVLLISLLVCMIGHAHAHDASRPELNSWFDHLASGKGLCCSVADGFALADADWESKDGHYRVRIGSVPLLVVFSEVGWIDVPDDAVITEPNRAGRTMVWPMRLIHGEIDVISIRCFMPGSMT